MNKSMTAAILVIFAGYTVASYGWVLLKGWDIPFKAWVDPLDAYRWPAGGTPDLIKAGRVFPSQSPLNTPGSSFAAAGAAAANPGFSSGGSGG